MRVTDPLKLEERPAFAAEAAASADYANQIKDTTGVIQWRLHFSELLDLWVRFGRKLARVLLPVGRRGDDFRNHNQMRKRICF